MASDRASGASSPPSPEIGVAPLMPWLRAPLERLSTPSAAHALLLHGPRGVGQFELALELASAWLCEAQVSSRESGRACFRCAACHLLAARTHPDLLVLVPETLQLALTGTGPDAERASDGEGSKAARKPSKEIKVEAIRSAIAFAQQSSARGGHKVAVLFPAERINPAGSNMLLKTLEEPPGRMRFVLASAAPQRLLATVRSRCQAVALGLPPADVARTWLASKQVDQPDILLAAAGGSPSEALERLSLGVDARAWRDLPADVAAGRTAGLVGWPLPLVIDALQKLCHDAMARAVGAPPRFFAEGDVPSRGDLGALAAVAHILRDAARHAEHPLNAALGVEALVARLRRALAETQRTNGGGSPDRALATLDR